MFAMRVFSSIMAVTTPAAAGIPNIAKTSETTTPIKQTGASAVTWGRTNSPQLLNNVGAAFMLTFCPVWMWINWVTLEHFDGSILALVRSVFSRGLHNLGKEFIPQHSHTVAIAYMA